MSETTITARTQWMSHSREDGDQSVLDLELAYNPAVPHAVQMRLIMDADDPDSALVWEIDRALLLLALTSWGGDGDVRIRLWTPQPGLVLIELRDDLTARWGRFLARHREIADFVDRTFELVPAGDEAVDVDGLLEQLLGGEGR